MAKALAEAQTKVKSKIKVTPKAQTKHTTRLEAHVKHKPQKVKPKLKAINADVKAKSNKEVRNHPTRRPAHPTHFPPSSVLIIYTS